MGLIDYQITESNTELIRKRIGEIITHELADQTEASGVSIWDERSIDFNHTELPAINISYDSSNFDNHTVAGKRSTGKFYIDVMVAEKHTALENGDKLASIKCQRLANIISYILSSVEYYRLGFIPGIIASRWVESIDIGRVSNHDAKHTIAARLTYNVITNDKQIGESTGVDILEIYTNAKIEETESGYLWRISDTIIPESIFTDDTVFTEETILI